MIRQFHTRQLCRVLASICILIAVGQLAKGVMPLISPLALTSRLSCTNHGCSYGQDALQLIPAHKRNSALAPATRAAIEERLERLDSRLLLAASLLVVGVPNFFLYFGLSKVFGIAARRGPFDPAVLKWVQWSALAALIAAIATPIATGLRSAAILPAVDPAAEFSFFLNLTSFLGDILLAAIIFAAAWAVAHGHRLQEESESFL